MTAKTSALKEQILDVLDQIGDTYTEIAVDSDPEVTEGQMSTLSGLVERLDKLVNYLPEESGESVSDDIPIYPVDCDDHDTSTDYP